MKCIFEKSEFSKMHIISVYIYPSGMSGNPLNITPHVFNIILINQSINLHRFYKFPALVG